MLYPGFPFLLLGAAVFLSRPEPPPSAPLTEPAFVKRSDRILEAAAPAPTPHLPDTAQAMAAFPSKE